MFLYQLQGNFRESVYLIDVDDSVSSGIEGADSKPNYEIGERLIYLQDRKMFLLFSDGEPTDDIGIDVNDTVKDRLLYLDTSTGSFYTITSYSESGIVWKNITSTQTNNYNGVLLQNNMEIVFDGNELVLKDSSVYSGLVLKVNALQYENMDVFLQTQTQSKDDQLLLNFLIQGEAENVDGKIGLKNYDEGDAYQPQYINWDENLERYDIINGSDYGEIEVGNILISDVEVFTEYDYVIINQNDFDTVFNDTYANSGNFGDRFRTQFFVDNPNVKNIYVFSGEYTLDDPVWFDNTDGEGGYKLRMSPFSKIKISEQLNTFLENNTLMERNIIEITGNYNDITFMLDCENFVTTNGDLQALIYFTAESKFNKLTIGIENYNASIKHVRGNSTAKFNTVEVVKIKDDVKISGMNSAVIKGDVKSSNIYNSEFISIGFMDGKATIG